MGMGMCVCMCVCMCLCVCMCMCMRVCGPASAPSVDAALALRLRQGLAKVWLGPLLPWRSSESSHSAKWPPLPTAR